MPLFDALCTAFGTAGTGGFAIKNDSMAGYSPYLQNVTTVFMFLFWVNFSCYFLLLLRPLTPFRTSVVSKKLGSSRLSFGPVETMEEKMHLTSGSVSPLGLLFDQEHTIKLAYESAVRRTPRIAFHPCDNAATIIFAQDVFWDQVVPALGIVPSCIDLPENNWRKTAKRCKINIASAKEEKIYVLW